MALIMVVVILTNVGGIRYALFPDRALLRTLRTRYASPVSSVAFAPDGQTLASGSYDIVKLWRISDGSELRDLGGHTGGVDSVAFAPDGQTHRQADFVPHRSNPHQ